MDYTLIKYLLDKKQCSCYFKEADVPADKTAFKVYDNKCVPIAYYVPENVDELYKHLTRQYVLKTLADEKGIDWHDTVAIGRQYKGDHEFVVDIDCDDAGSLSSFKTIITTIQNRLNELLDTTVQTWWRQPKGNKYGAHIYTGMMVKECDWDRLKNIVYNDRVLKSYSKYIDKSMFSKSFCFCMQGSCKPDSHMYHPFNEQDTEPVKLNAENLFWETGDVDMLVDMFTDDLFEQHSDSALTINDVENRAEMTEIQPKMCKKSRQNVHDNLGFLTEICEMISTDYLDDYSTWITIGLAMKNSGLPVELYEKISKKSNKNNEDDCTAKWDSFNKEVNNPVTAGTLCYYARLSDLTKYQELCKKHNTEEYLFSHYTEIDCVEWMMAQKNNSIAKKINGIRCFCTKETGRRNLDARWIRFDEEHMCYLYVDEEIIKTDLFNDMHDRAKKILDIYTGIINTLSDFIDGNRDSFITKIIENNKNGIDICDILRDYELYKCRAKCNKLDKDDKNDMHEKIENIFAKLTKKAESLKKIYTVVQKNIKKTADALNTENHRLQLATILQNKTIILQRDFVTKFNMQKHTVVFKNGVYDCFKKEFIDSRMNTLTCGRRYVKPTQRAIDWYNSYMASIFPDKRVRDLMNIILAKCMTCDSMQYVYFLTGQGSNGKTLFTHFMEKLLSSDPDTGYYKTIGSGFFTAVVKKGAADPEEMDLLHKRVAVCEEPDSDIKISESTFKRMSGDVTITGRYLFSNQMLSFKPTAKCFIVCNSLPQTKDLSYGFQRRVVIINFNSTFCSQSEYERRLANDEPDVYPINPQIEADFEDDDLMDQIASYIVDNFYTVNNTLEIPDPCILAANEYIDECNTVKQFVQECLEEDEESSCDVNELYFKYTDWMKSFAPNETILKKTPLIRKMKGSINFTMRKDIKPYQFRGIKIRTM